MSSEQTSLVKIDIPFFLALDVDDIDVALKLAEDVSSYVGGYKIGPRLTFRYGAELVKKLSQHKPVVVDGKFYDIPHTMETSVRAVFDSGASFCTIHAECGLETLKRLKSLEDEISQQRPFQILAVTVLTSEAERRGPKSVRAKVFSLAQDVIQSGLKGLVCSAHEVSDLRKKYSQSFLMTPGIRFMNEKQEDQKRTMSPAKAIAEGSSAIVVGRPVCEAENPVQVVKSYFAAIMAEKEEQQQQRL